MVAGTIGRDMSAVLLRLYAGFVESGTQAGEKHRRWSNEVYGNGQGGNRMKTAYVRFGAGRNNKKGG